MRPCRSLPCTTDIVEHVDVLVLAGLEACDRVILKEGANLSGAFWVSLQLDIATGHVPRETDPLCQLALVILHLPYGDADVSRVGSLLCIRINDLGNVDAPLSFPSAEGRPSCSLCNALFTSSIFPARGCRVNASSMLWPPSFACLMISSWSFLKTTTWPTSIFRLKGSYKHAQHESSKPRRAEQTSARITGECRST